MSARSSSSRVAVTGGTHDEAPGDAGPMGLQDALQPAALLIARNLARHADVVHGGHINQKAARQGDVRGDARAFLPQRLFGDLDDNLLAFLQQIADGGAGGFCPAFRFRLPAPLAVPVRFAGAARFWGVIPQAVLRAGRRAPGRPNLRGPCAAYAATRGADSGGPARAEWPSGWWGCGRAPALPHHSAISAADSAAD